LSKGLNWDQVKAVLLSLAISPLIGFVGAALLLLIVKSLIKDPDLYNSPKDGQPPVPWIRGLLILTCTGVSFAHGSNDGQKGMGLLMLITVGILPGIFALKIDTKPVQIAAIITQSQKVSAMMQTHADGMKLTNDSTATKLLTEYIHTEGKFSPPIFAALAEKTSTVAANLRGVTSFRSLSSAQRITLRTDAYLLSDSISKMDKKKILKGPDDKLAMSYSSKELGNMSQYIPVWVKVAVAFALGFGTMVGWKRIVVTVGERIGKKHLTYAEGACAELVTMATIGGATSFGLPASTTHVLASGIAGTMEANGSGLQTQTIRNIVLAWVLTLPVCILLGATIFSGTLYVILHMLKIQ
jgi:PiT family inorganic phosphate transporter